MLMATALDGLDMCEARMDGFTRNISIKIKLFGIHFP